MKVIMSLILGAFVVIFLTGSVDTQATSPTCDTIGSFEIYDGTCRNYYMCVDNGEELVSVVLSCASTALFDANIGACTACTDCECLQTTTTTPATTTTTAATTITTTTVATTTTTTEAPCVRYGRFAIKDPNCKSYYLCYWNGTGYSKMTNLTCPNSLVFDPVREVCTLQSNYSCPKTT